VVGLMDMTKTVRSKNSRFLTGIALCALLLGLRAGTCAAQSAGDDQELVAAERALLEGLSSKGGSPFGAEKPVNNAANGAELKPATYSQPIIKQDPPKSAPSEDIQEHELTPKRDLPPQRVVKPEPEELLVEEAPEHVRPVATTHNPNNALRRDLEASQKRVSELERQLEEVRGQLTMAETELSRLATINEARTRASFGRVANADTASRTTAQPSSRAETPHIEPTPSGSADLAIATVNVDKAELRLGAGKNHSALMTVAKGSRLAVEARQGEWLRVFAPNGQRAWILAKLVSFGTKTNPTTSVRVKGYSGALEDDAFKRVQSLTSGR